MGTEPKKRGHKNAYVILREAAKVKSKEQQSHFNLLVFTHSLALYHCVVIWGFVFSDTVLAQV